MGVINRYNKSNRSDAGLDFCKREVSRLVDPEANHFIEHRKIKKILSGRESIYNPAAVVPVDVDLMLMILRISISVKSIEVKSIQG